MNRENGFIVNYTDDFNVKHITFVRGMSDVKFLKDRYDSPINYEPVKYYQQEDRPWYEGIRTE